MHLVKKITWEVCAPVARRSKSLAGDRENPLESRGSGKYKVKDMENIPRGFFKRIRIRKTQVKSFHKVKDQEKTKNPFKVEIKKIQVF